VVEVRRETQLAGNHGTVCQCGRLDPKTAAHERQAGDTVFTEPFEYLGEHRDDSTQ
jgi:hypothetical protein